MTKTKQTKADIIDKQARKILELESQLAHRYHFANQTIDKCSTKHLMASGVLLQLTGVGGKELINPVMIKDGLSTETIEAIKKDLKRSYDLAIMYAVK
jgi:hypothetical protein